MQARHAIPTKEQLKCHVLAPVCLPCVISYFVYSRTGLPSGEGVYSMGYRLKRYSCNPTASISFKMPHKQYASAASEVSNSLNAFKVYSTVSRNRRMVYTQK